MAGGSCSRHIFPVSRVGVDRKAVAVQPAMPRPEVCLSPRRAVLLNDLLISTSPLEYYLASIYRLMREWC
jgi:hypothetical protein